MSLLAIPFLSDFFFAEFRSCWLFVHQSWRLPGFFSVGIARVTYIYQIQTRLKPKGIKGPYGLVYASNYANDDVYFYLFCTILCIVFYYAAATYALCASAANFVLANILNLYERKPALTLHRLFWHSVTYHKQAIFLSFVFFNFFITMSSSENVRTLFGMQGCVCVRTDHTQQP